MHVTPKASRKPSIPLGRRDSWPYPLERNDAWHIQRFNRNASPLSREDPADKQVWQKAALDRDHSVTYAGRALCRGVSSYYDPLTRGEVRWPSNSTTCI